MRALNTFTKTTVAVGALALLLSGLAQAGPAPKKGAQAAKASAGQAPRESVAPSKQGVVNINSADEQQLCLLPGIGPSKARAIIKHRTKQKFSGTWDIVRVRGIGRKSYRTLRPFLSINGQTTLTTKAQVKKGDKG